MKEVDSRGDAIVNLLHYDDAASACVAALREEARGIFIVSDGNPLTRRDICVVAKEEGGLSGSIPYFVGLGDDVGKVYDVTKFRSVVKSWELKHSSFAVGVRGRGGVGEEEEVDLEQQLLDMDVNDLREFCILNNVKADDGSQNILIKRLLACKTYSYSDSRKRLDELESQAMAAIGSIDPSFK